MDLAHSLEVANKFDIKKEPNVWLAAFFHDAIEDGYATAEQLLESGLPYFNVVEIVQVLTRHRDTETYRDYIGRLSIDAVATRIKIADLEVNLDRMDEAHESLRPRYVWAIKYLEKVMKDR